MICSKHLTIVFTIIHMLGVVLLQRGNIKRHGVILAIHLRKIIPSFLWYGCSDDKN